MVHCSAGVGRTGTFIAFYKLLEDYEDKQKKSLNVYKTVLEMRRQRYWMVQKQEQYAYIFKCIWDEIKSKESEAEGHYHGLP